MTFLRACLLGLLSLLCLSTVQAAPMVVGPGAVDRAVGMDLEYLQDPSGQLSLSDIQRPPYAQQFQRTRNTVTNFGFSKASYWLRIRIHWQNPSLPEYFLWQEFPLTDRLFFYRPLADGRYEKLATGDQIPFATRELGSRAFGLRLLPQAGQTDTIYIQLRGAGRLTLDLQFSDAAAALRNTENRHLLYGFYYGAALALMLYNLILFISLREIIYAYYAIYVAGLGMTFFTLHGLAFRYLWPESPAMNTYFLAFAYLGFIGLLQFTRHFLQLPKNLPGMDKLLSAFILINLAAMASIWLVPSQYIYATSQAITLSVALLTMLSGLLLWAKGYRPARYYVLATVGYFLSLIAYPLQSFGILPVTEISDLYVLFGSALEMVLLSFALADRINHMKQEKQRLEDRARAQLEEANQNLEIKVNERTLDLLDTVRALEDKHRKLVSAQEQLIQSEKMSSLGALVAGVAHEINNPANFTRLSAENLERDLNKLEAFLWSLTDEDSDPELLAELEQRFARLQRNVGLVHDGTGRLNSIVADLRRFSRLDEAETKTASPDQGLAATLNLVHAQYKDRVCIDYQAANPDAQGPCHPAALNQVFMNLAVNACQAIEARARQGSATPDELGRVGTLKIQTSTYCEAGQVYWRARFQDNGIGMDGPTRQRIFEPFFTTKGVGEGTGLGLSISYGIMQKHGGSIQVDSTPGRGSSFLLTFPLATLPVLLTE